MHEGQSEPRLGRDAPPFGQGGRTSLLVDFPADEMALRIEVVVDLAVDGNEFLKCLRPTEFERRRLSSSKRLVGILGPIILPATDVAASEVADLPHRRAVGAQPVGDNDFGTAVALRGFLEEFQGGGLVPRLADEELQHLALVIDGPPKIVELTVDLHKNLIDMPAPAAEVSSPHPPRADIASEQWTKAVPPKPYRLMAGVDAALMQQILHIPQSQGVTHVHHHREADHLRRRIEIAKRIGFGAHHPSSLPFQATFGNLL